MEENCTKAMNSFLIKTYNIEPEDLTPDDNFDIITLSKYKSSTSPPSTQQLVLKKKKDKGKGPSREDQSGQRLPKASSSKTPTIILDNPIFTMGEQELKQETEFNTIMNEANSAHKFDSVKEYRQYKINQQNLISLQEFIDSFNLSPPLVEQPQPFLTDLQQIPKKSPLDVFGLKLPQFDGIKEHAQSFISEFIRFCNAYTSFHDDSDLIKAFIKCQKFENISKNLTNFINNNPTPSFEDLCQFFITSHGTRSISEHINFWNTFRLNFKFPNDSRSRLETAANALHFSKYDCSARLLSVLPIRWKKIPYSI